MIGIGRAYLLWQRSTMLEQQLALANTFDGCANSHALCRKIMDSPTCSERSRRTAIHAALTIITRDGPGHLTFDAIAREIGVSKDRLIHQFRTKENLLKALLEHQTRYFESFSRDYLVAIGSAKPETTLLAQIATTRESMAQPHSIVFAIFAALVEDPELLSTNREIDAKNVKRIEEEAADPELAMLRWTAARGLALMALFELCPLSEKERERLFDRLLDEHQWLSPSSTSKQRSVGSLENLFRGNLAAIGSGRPETTLLTQIATVRESIAHPHPAAFAIFAALMDDPELPSINREINAKKLERMKEEAAAPELAVLRWAAAIGLALTTLFDLCPLSEKKRGRLFDRLLDERQWQ